jgi:hypothetical protein
MNRLRIRMSTSNLDPVKEETNRGKPYFYDSKAGTDTGTTK